MDRELSAELIKERKKKKYRKIAIYILSLLFLIILISINLSVTVNIDDIETDVVERGEVAKTYTATGVVIPSHEQIITSPIESKILEVYFKSGQTIKQGDRILKIDVSQSELELSKLEDEIKLKENNIDQMRSVLEKELIELVADSNVKSLRVALLESKFIQEKRLFKIGAGSKGNLESAELNKKISEIELIKIKKQIINKKKTFNYDIKKLSLELGILKKNLKDLKQKIKRAYCISEFNGVLTWVSTEKGSILKTGDVYAKIANLDSFKVNATISDIYSDYVRENTRTIVRIKSKDLNGYISNINPTIEDGVQSFVVALNEQNQDYLRPNLRVDVFIISSMNKDVLRVKNSDFYNGGKSQNIFVVENNDAVSKKVTFGESNIDYVEIINGLNEGDEIIISRMNDYNNLDKIEIERN